MGGDGAPKVIIDGIAEASQRYPNVKFLIFGDQLKIKPLIQSYKFLLDCCEIFHTDDVVSDNQSLSQAIRRGRDTSMWKASESVKNGLSHGLISAGNTGVLMAMSKLNMKTLPGIDRPAICSLFPNRNSETVMLDLGANAQCSVRNLVEFALMGASFSSIITGLEKPIVGLLNIGSEDLKGTDLLKESAAVLRSSELELDFYGFVEGDDIALGTVDVVVTDGFTGNVALKTAEGTAKLYSQFLKSAFESSFYAKIGYLLIKPVLGQVIMKTDPRRYNGALFVGLNGIAVKSHGGTDALGFANAIGVGVDMVDRDLNNVIGDQLGQLNFESIDSAKALSK